MLHKDIKYFHMREEMIDNLRTFIDNPKMTCDKIYDDIDIAIHFFYDDTLLAEEPSKLVGYIIFESELYFLKRFVEKLDDVANLYKEYSREVSDLFRREEWISACIAAQNLLTEMNKIEKH